MTAPTLPDEPATAKTSDRFSAFGLTVEVDWPVTGLQAARPVVAAERPLVAVRALPADELAGHWRHGLTRLYERNWRGELVYTIDRAADRYLLWTKGYGSYVVSADGATVSYEAGCVTRQAQERFLFAQVLPLASALHGFELLHASAVCIGDRLVAFVGPSGAGKTTLMTRLLERGARFFADDVLALEARVEAPLGYPGSPFLALAHNDRELAARLGSTVGETDKLLVSVPITARPTRLCALYHVDHAGSRANVKALGDDVVMPLLGVAFAPYLATPDRLRRQLDMAQLLSRTVPQFRLHAPRTDGIEAMVQAVHDHVQEGII